MTDYQPLIARAVDGLPKNTGEARRALYERARSALVAQLRAVEPVLSESDITKERLALEEAIRKVESEAARKALAEPRAQIRTDPRFESRVASRSSTTEPRASLGVSLRRERTAPAAAETPTPDSLEHADEAAETPPSAAKPTARRRILEARTSTITQEGLKGFRNVVNEVDGLGAATARAAQTARDMRDSYAPGSRQRSPRADDFAAPPPEHERIEPQFEDEEAPPQDDALNLQSLEPSYDPADEEPPRSARPHPPRPVEFEDEEEEYEEPRPPRSYGKWIRIALFLIVASGVAAAAWTYRSNIAGAFHFFAPIKSQAPAQISRGPTTPKDTGRVPQEHAPGEVPATVGPGAAPNPQPAPGVAQQAPRVTPQPPGVAQRAFLLEKDQGNGEARRFTGSVVWRVQTVSPGPGLTPELEVRGDIAIPDRNMTVTWSIRRNTDPALPASHTIQIMFNLPVDFPGGGISSVAGVMMKKTEEAPGTPLAAMSVKVTDTYFLMGLSSDPSLQPQNLALLKDQEWFDIPIVYKNGTKALLVIERGPPGDQAFADAFAAWGN
jgi:hypothetical protein